MKDEFSNLYRIRITKYDNKTIDRVTLINNLINEIIDYLKTSDDREQRILIKHYVYAASDTEGLEDFRMEIHLGFYIGGVEFEDPEFSEIHYTMFESEPVNVRVENAAFMFATQRLVDGKYVQGEATGSVHTYTKELIENAINESDVLIENGISTRYVITSTN